jgi:hydroxyethylthiazole kinase-like uncharacterized protein yjeF
MKLVPTNEISRWDAYTIDHGPIKSHVLMERAAHAVFLWLDRTFGDEGAYCVICGPGNNGGDGLCIARMLSLKGRKVEVWYMDMKQPSADNQLNMYRLHSCRQVSFRTIASDDKLPGIPDDCIIVDAWMGTGFRGQWGDYWIEKVEQINDLPNIRVSVDIPSGVFDQFDQSSVAVKADVTLSFQQPKISFFYPYASRYTGKWIVLDIGLLPDFLDTFHTPFRWTNACYLRDWVIKKDTFFHKGRGGHALVIAGSEYMPGASVLAAEACIKAGAALVSYKVPPAARQSLAVRSPEAMVAPWPESEIWPSADFMEKTDAVGIGPGLGQQKDALVLLQYALECRKPLVLDADALNLIAQNLELLSKIPENTILTPHPGEFSRLFGTFENDILRDEMAAREAVRRKIIIVLKGAYSRIFLPSGEVWFNTTGNPGMAKGGTGDVLTGMITALLAQGYAPERAAILGTFLHGEAGDIASDTKTAYAASSTDVISSIPEAWKKLCPDNRIAIRK